MEVAASMSQDQRQAFAELLQHHRGLVFKVANSYANNPDDRAELAQEIAAQLWRAWGSYDPRRPLATWMYRIALNVGISHLRSRSRADAHMVPLEAFEHDAADVADVAGEPEQAQQLRLLQRVIARLDPLNRALLLLYLDERSQREIGEILGISESNVSTRISRLKQRIRNELT